MNLFEFTGLHGCDSKCGVEVIDKGQSHAVVIVTELEDDNTGTSVTNAWPELADDIEREYNLGDHEVTWIEHYPERGSSLRRLPETFCQVFLIKGSKGHQMTPTCHPWKHLTKEEIEASPGV